jgi:5-methylcytosine-specific restriction endonuclease McrA
MSLGKVVDRIEIQRKRQEYDGDMNNRPRKRRKLTPYKRNLIAAAGNWMCRGGCNHLLPAMFHIDHIRALCDGGEDTIENMRAICPGCHAVKSALEVERYWDRKREISSKTSKYFDPMSKYYLPTPVPPTNCSKLFSHMSTNKDTNVKL